MAKYLKVGFYGFLISFLGSLPPATLTVTAFSVSASQSINDALWFSLAVVLVELIIVRLTLMGEEKINFEGKLSFYLIPIAAALLLYLAINSFISVGKASELSTGSKIFSGIESPFLLGILLSALNPLHIPFWMGWNRVLVSKNTLQKTWSSYTSYIISIGIGTIGALMVYIFAGSHIFQNYDQYSMVIDLCLGVLYLGFSLYLFFLLYKKHLKFKIH